MKNPIYVLLGIGLIALTGCGLNSAPKKLAGQGTQTGILIQGNPTETKAQIESSGVEHRVLNEKHGLYEVFGVDAQEAQELFPKADAQPNHYIANLIPGKNKGQVYRNLMKTNGNISKLAQAGGQQQLPPILKTCKMEVPEDASPVADISTDFPMTKKIPASKYIHAHGTTELNSLAVFSSANSAYLDGTPVDGLKTRWLIVAPQHSKLNPEIQEGTELKFIPDNVGSYDIIEVVEDANNACGFSMFTLLVTTNPVLNLPLAGDKKPSVDFEFNHLDRVNAREGWELSTGKSVTVAILDTGLNFNSRAILWNLALDQSELAGSAGSDTDGNGFAHDYLGWDFVNDDNNAFDDEGHGSHCSGITASHIFGIAKDAKILPVKVMNAAGGGSAGDIAAGILYAVDKGAKIINMSLGAHGPTLYPVRKAIRYAQSQGVLVVVASGNGHPETGEGLDLNEPELDFIDTFDVCPAGGSGSPFFDQICEMGFERKNLVDVFPAEFKLDNILTVAATNENDTLTAYSNFGTPMVDVAAPGGSNQDPIWSLATQNTENYPLAPSVGTSMASPLVAGIAALLLEVDGTLTPTDIIALLKQTGTASGALAGKINSGTVVNAIDVLEAAGANVRAPVPFASNDVVHKDNVLVLIQPEVPMASGIAASAL